MNNTIITVSSLKQVGNPGRAGAVVVKTAAKEIKVVPERVVPETAMAQQRRRERATNSSAMVRETSVFLNEAFFWLLAQSLC